MHLHKISDSDGQVMGSAARWLRAELLGWPDNDEGDWQSRGICAQTDPDVFFPEKGGSVALAKAICRRCPVRAECLDYALAHDERHGVWGGLSERERRTLRLRRRDLAA